MDQQRFESEVLKALGSEAPSPSADEPFEGAAASEAEHDEDDYGEDNALEDTAVEEMDTYEDSGEEAFLGEDAFDEQGREESNDLFGDDALDAMEESLADALAAREGDEFFRALLGGVGQIAGAAQRGATRVSQTARRAGEAVTEGAARVSTAAGRVGGAAREAAQARNPLGHFLRLLRQHQRQGFDELDSLEELSDEFAEGDYDEAIPVLAGLAARSVLTAAAGRAVRRVSRPLRRRVLRSAVQTAQSLVRQGGSEGMRALPRIVRRVARRAARTGLRPSALPQAIQRTAAQVLAQRAPGPVGSQAVSATTARGRGRGEIEGFPRRLTLQGPVEIRIFGR